MLFLETVFNLCMCDMILRRLQHRQWDISHINISITLNYVTAEIKKMKCWRDIKVELSSFGFYISSILESHAYISENSRKKSCRLSNLIPNSQEQFTVRVLSCIVKTSIGRFPQDPYKLLSLPWIRSCDQQLDPYIGFYHPFSNTLGD